MVLSAIKVILKNMQACSWFQVALPRERQQRPGQLCFAQAIVCTFLCTSQTMSPFHLPFCHPLQFIQDEGMVTTLQRKLAPPLVTLLGVEPELQYVVRAWMRCVANICVGAA